MRKPTTKTIIISIIALAVIFWGYAIIGIMADSSAPKHATAAVPESLAKAKTPVQTAVTAQAVQPTAKPQPVAPFPVKIVTVPVVQPTKPVQPTRTETPTPVVVNHPVVAPSTPAPAPQTTTCPASTSQGTYFQRGTDANGKPVCAFAYYQACPYSEAVSASDPMCYKGQK